MRMPRLLLVLVLVVSCSTAEPDLVGTAQTSMSTLNAENDVYGLVVRFHEARQRAAAYADLVLEEQRKVSEIQFQLAAIEPVMAKAKAELEVATTRHTEAVEAKTAATEAAAAIEAEVKTMTDGIAASTARRVTLEGELASLGEEVARMEGTLAQGREEQKTLSEAEARLRGHLADLRSRVSLLKTAHRTFSERLETLDQEIEAVENQGKQKKDEEENTEEEGKDGL
jgi:chromosome segregation ATPase